MQRFLFDKQIVDIQSCHFCELLNLSNARTIKENKYFFFFFLWKARPKRLTLNWTGMIDDQMLLNTSPQTKLFQWTAFGRLNYGHKLRSNRGSGGRHTATTISPFMISFVGCCIYTFIPVLCRYKLSLICRSVCMHELALDMPFARGLYLCGVLFTLQPISLI